MGAAGSVLSVLPVIGAVGQLVSGRSAERQAERESKRRQAQQQAMIGDLRANEANTQRQRALLAGRQQSLGLAGMGQRDTLLTGPSGLAGAAPGDTGERKSLLGL